jgi:sirohydrochlorin ferrochelatase/(2Fe-2S) ferredoxin
MPLPILGQHISHLRAPGEAARSQEKPLHGQKQIGLIIVGHGSRDSSANAEFEILVANFRVRHPEFDVCHAYIEIASPSLAASLSASASRNRHIVVAPLFLFGAGHLKNDIPLALAAAREQHPDVVFTATRELGVHPSLIELAFQRASSLFPQEHAATKTAVIVVGRGASDPDANGDFCKLVRLFGEGHNFTWVLPSFIGITRPSFEEAAELVARSRPDRILVVPYFLFAGRLLSKLQDQVSAFSVRSPWIRISLAPCLGIDNRVLAVMNERIEEALRGEKPLPCDTCQYRTPISGITQNVGGLRSLLWSLRHAFTHTQAVPHIHAHRRLTKHVLVCGNVDCAERGSIALISSLRRSLKITGYERDIRVTRTGCMGRCGEGPTVAVYPDGIWYREVQESDAAEFVEEHLIHDRLVARLVDNIMQ